MAFISMTVEMLEQASVGWLSIDSSFKFCSILDDINADERNPIINRELHRER